MTASGRFVLIDHLSCALDIPYLTVKKTSTNPEVKPEINPTVPQMGDDSNLPMWIAISILALAASSAVLIIQKKRIIKSERIKRSR